MSDRNITTDWTLPPDIEVIIIDHFLDHKPTLASCSLVCSRWLPRSRKHLFRDITIKQTDHLTLPLADFLRIVEHSGAVNPEWGVGAYIKMLSLNGRLADQQFNLGTPTAACTLPVLRALLARLPHLASLCVTKFLIVDDAPQIPNAGRCHLPPFEIDELSISCCSGPTKDVHPLLALICTFSRVGSLCVDRWGKRRPNPPSTFSLAPFSPPVIRSFVLGRGSDKAARRALYAVLATSPPVTDACLTRLSVNADEYDDVVMFTTFVDLAGAALRDVELRVLEPDIRLDLLSGIFLPACTALSSLTLSFQCCFNDSFLEDAEDIRDMFGVYTALLRSHCHVFVGLKTIRLEMRPIGKNMLVAFRRVAQDTFLQGPDDAVHTVPPPEADQNRAVWGFLEDVLCDFPALQRVEIVLFETPRPGGALTEAAKVELRRALEEKLPRLSRNGTAQLVFYLCSIRG
uniref:N/A n=1 Tax=Ganoderma boninense TaxID=34458 RepID=A0A5K1K6Q2_9APHY|nr:N/A [Ganoderma boninense]